MTVPQGTEKKSEDIKAAEDAVAAEWNVGDVILDTYEVKQVHTGGGMGLVYRVHHRNWNMDLAVKSPRPEYFSSEEQKANFIRECETWINLGLHPNIVSCYYVRTLGGIPRVFAEYVEGGSLRDWIESKRLYEGGFQETLKRVLDIAIQFAWGLHYAHEHEEKLVHQDVKPANVMMTSEGDAKVTDFGLAKARAVAGEIGAGAAPGHGQQSILVSSGGMTPAYCSPEQANGEPLTRKTDIWSWGLSVLEMFTGEVTWASGVAAPEALEGYLEAGAEDESIPKMPQGVADLLKQCFQRNLEDRPKDMGEIANRLKDICRETTGQEYGREEPLAAELLADGLNNRALSLLDVGRKEEARKAWQDALNSDPLHVGATFNIGLGQWAEGEISDDQFIGSLQSVYDNSKDEELLFSLARVHLLRRCPAETLAVLSNRTWSHSPPVPASADSWNTYGVALADVDAFDKAEACFRQVATLQPTHLGYALNSAYAILRQGKPVPSSLLALLRQNAALIWESYSLPHGTDILQWLHKWQPDAIVETQRFDKVPSSVWGMAFCADGRLAFSAGREILDNKTDVYERGAGLIGWWAFDSGGKSETAGEGLSSVANVSASPDGAIVVSACDNRIAPLHLRTVLDVEDQVGCVAVSPTKPCVALCYSGGGNAIVDLAKGLPGTRFGSEGAYCAAFSPDGTMLAIGHESRLAGGNMVDIYSVSPFERVLSCGGPMPVHAITWLDGHSLATADHLNKDIRIVRISSDAQPESLAGHSKGITSLVQTRHGAYLLSGGLDGTVRLWDVRRRRCDTTLLIGKAVNCVAVSPNGNSIAAGGLGGSTGKAGILRVWSLSLAHANCRPHLDRATLLVSRPSAASEVIVRRNRVRESIRKVEELGSSLANAAERISLLRRAQSEIGFERDSDILAHIRRCAGDSSPAMLRQAWAAKRINTGAPAELACVDSLTGRIAIAERAGRCNLWKMSSEGEAGPLTTKFKEWARALCFSGDHRHLVMGGEHGSRMSFFSVEFGCCDKTVELSPMGITTGVVGMAFSEPPGRAALCWTGVAGVEAGGVAVLDMHLNRIIFRTEYKRHFVWAVAISANGNIVAAASNFSTGGDNWVRVYDVAQGAEVRHVGTFSMAANSLVMTRDGQYLAAGSFDGTAEVWHVPSGEMVGHPLRHGAEVSCVDLSADARFCVTGGRDNAIRLWDVRSGACLHILRAHQEPLKKVAFTADLFQVLSVDAGGSIVVWEIDWTFAMETGATQKGPRAPGVRLGVVERHGVTQADMPTLTAQSDQTIVDVASSQHPREQFRDSLVCQYCGKRNTAAYWPEAGDRVAFYYQKESGSQVSESFSLPVMCLFCKKVWYVVWDANIDPLVRPILSHMQRMCDEPRTHSATAEALRAMICEKILGRYRAIIQMELPRVVQQKEVREQKFVEGTYYNIVTLVPATTPDGIRSVLNGSYMAYLQRCSGQWDKNSQQLAHWLLGCDGQGFMVHLMYVPLRSETRPKNTYLPVELLTLEERRIFGI